MCGIVGAIRSDNKIVEFLTDGLKRMEYRGYDSSGIAVLMQNQIKRVRRVGRISELDKAVSEIDLVSNVGIGHTRWATHGEVTEPNAHPHVSHQKIVLVHNGIIENYQEEKRNLIDMGYEFESQTDTEVIAHSIHHDYQTSSNLFEAVRKTTLKFQGAYAIGVLCLDEPDVIVLARMGCPLLIGLGEEENFFASDVSALVAYTRDIIYLEDGDIAQISIRGIDNLLDKTGRVVEREVKQSQVSLTSLELGPYSHFMQKEIYEQPKAIIDTTEVVFSTGFVPSLFGEKAETIFNEINSVKILACGSSYYAGITAKYWLESIAKIPTDVEIASEYRYREVVSNPRQLILTVSQSGETLDTIEALKRAKSLGHDKTLAICNVMESALVRESELVFYTRAGAEICVASTKAFTTQLVVLFIFTITLGRLKGYISEAQAQIYLEDLRHLPGSVQAALNLEPQITQWANLFSPKDHALFLGRGIHYPVALEGALKLKEITYIHAEAYPAGELKHGPLALVDQDMPVVIVAPNDSLLDKLKSNMQEVVARGGELFVFTDADSDYEASKGIRVIRTPRHVGTLSAIVHTIPVQLLAYHTALAKGTDVDKPRNLAKSVTVE
ncbi:MAG: glutamine--fructose-6-phosphate transaminase (isomerizing) [Neisseriaceae bacterium]|nr:MAG: glutamine--fructose-6-phosphate transaminase (isomerizing) [Neisseriaceae bacterium]